MNYVVWGLVVLVIIAHQDFWNWSDRTLVFGFFPIGLLYHAGISVTAAFIWFLAIFFCWPRDIEEETLAAVGEAPETEGGAAE